MIRNLCETLHLFGSNANSPKILLAFRHDFVRRRFFRSDPHQHFKSEIHQRIFQSAISCRFSDFYFILLLTQEISIPIVFRVDMAFKRSRFVPTRQHFLLSFLFRKYQQLFLEILLHHTAPQIVFVPLKFQFGYQNKPFSRTNTCLRCLMLSHMLR